MAKTWRCVVASLVLSLGLLLLFSVGASPEVAASTDNGDPPSTPVSWNIDLVGEISGGATDVVLVGDLLYVGAGSKRPFWTWPNLPL